MTPAITHGAFSWSELMTSDPAAAALFYGKVLGWASSKMPMPTGEYHLQMRGKTPVAGIMEVPEKSMPTEWAHYVTVSNVDETLKLAESLGAKVVQPAMDVPTVGRMGGIVDPHGACISVITYEPMGENDEHPDPDFATHFVTPGTFSWYELQTSDIPASCAFYQKLLGWEIKEMPMEGGPYHVIQVDGVGMGGITPLMDDGAPPHWGGIVTVSDVDAAVSTTTSAGGTVMVPPVDVPTVGRFALIQDPTGGMVNVIKYVQMEQPA